MTVPKPQKKTRYAISKLSIECPRLVGLYVPYQKKYGVPMLWSKESQALEFGNKVWGSRFQWKVINQKTALLQTIIMLECYSGRIRFDTASNRLKMIDSSKKKGQELLKFLLKQ